MLGLNQHQQYWGELGGGHCRREAFPYRYLQVSPHPSYSNFSSRNNCPVQHSWDRCGFLAFLYDFKDVKTRNPSPQTPAVAVSSKHHAGVRWEALEQSWYGRTAGTAQLRTAWKSKPQSPLVPPATALWELEDGWVQSSDCFLGQNHTDREWHHFYWNSRK